MATETLSLNQIDNAAKTLAIRTLGIDLDGYQQAMTDASDCHAAVLLLAERLTGRDTGLSMLLRGISAHLESVSDELRMTGKALGIEAATA